MNATENGTRVRTGIFALEPGTIRTTVVVFPPGTATTRTVKTPYRELYMHAAANPTA